MQFRDKKLSSREVRERMCHPLKRDLSITASSRIPASYSAPTTHANKLNTTQESITSMATTQQQNETKLWASETEGSEKQMEAVFIS